MKLDAATFHAIAKHVLPRGASLPAAEAIAIVHAAQIAAGVDLDGDAGETTMLLQLAQHVCATAGIDPATVTPASPLPIDDEGRLHWAARLADGLQTSGARELAYAVAYLVTIADVEIAPVESSFVEQFRVALGIDRERASELIAWVSALITPSIEPSHTDLR